MYLVSACLIGACCRYDGEGKVNKSVAEFYSNNDCIAICPEVLGGLLTPRLPSEISGERVMNLEGEDITKKFKEGARRVLEICIKLGIKKAILKEFSPSCGVNMIYDGTFEGNKIDGMGYTAKILKENGIVVLSDVDF